MFKVLLWGFFTPPPKKVNCGGLNKNSPLVSCIECLEPGSGNTEKD